MDAFPGVAVGARTYGCPRVGNVAFAEYYMAHLPDTQRMTHFRDPVPHVPFTTMGYHHVATEIWDINERNQTSNSQIYVLCDSSGEDRSCADSIPFMDTDLLDHSYYMGLSKDRCHD